MACLRSSLQAYVFCYKDVLAVTGGVFLGNDTTPTPAPLPVVQFGLPDGLDGASCGDCEQVWNVNADGHSCGARIDWLKQHGKSDHDAKVQVCIVEFVDQCGACCDVD